VFTDEFVKADGKLVMDVSTEQITKSLMVFQRLIMATVRSEQKTID
jgi:hypothetical protein